MRSVAGAGVGDILLETVEKVLRHRHPVSLTFISLGGFSLGFLFPDLEQVVVLNDF